MPEHLPEHSEGQRTREPGRILNRYVRSTWLVPGIVGLLTSACIVLVPLHQFLLGASMLAVAAAALTLVPRPAARDLSLVAGSIVLLAITPINTNIDPGHIAVMGFILMSAVLVPYLISRFKFGDHAITFPLHQGRTWYRGEIAYIAVTATIAYLFLPFYLHSTGSYQNWTVHPGFSYLSRLFLGTNGLGLWDELFFVCTVLALLRRHMPFWQANLAQASMWTAFLYELGFRGWGPIVIFVFALSQGYIFKRTASVLYIVTIHLTLDFVLYLALIHAYYPDWVPIFLTR